MESPLLRDAYGRQITYLRVSVTDRCNLRCVYCMPPGGIQRLPHGDIMRFEEIAAVAKTAAAHGVRAVRLTGGEPLVRKHLPELVRLLADIEGIDDISLTTNGLLLEKFAKPLAQAGLKRVNLSLDTLQPEKFARITRGGSLKDFWHGVAAAEQAGLTPIKLNTVVLRGVNDDELLALADLSRQHPWHVRFIELMPLNNRLPWGEGFPSPEDAYFSIQMMLQRLAPLGLEAVAASAGNGPARTFRLAGGQGLIGFISPLGEHFCQFCNRLRLTADGNFRPCLLGDLEIPVLSALRRGEPLLPLLQQAVGMKPLQHELLDNPNRISGRCMQQIGG